MSMHSVTLIFLHTGQLLSQIFLDLASSAFLYDQPQITRFWKERGRADAAVPGVTQKDMMSQHVTLSLCRVH